jgi:hypothetical protein
LRQNGNDPKVVQDLLRHATYGITANIYDSTVSKEKRKSTQEGPASGNPYPNPYRAKRQESGKCLI